MCAAALGQAAADIYHEQVTSWGGPPHVASDGAGKENISTFSRALRISVGIGVTADWRRQISQLPNGLEFARCGF